MCVFFNDRNFETLPFTHSSFEQFFFHNTGRIALSEPKKELNIFTNLKILIKEPGFLQARPSKHNTGRNKKKIHEEI